MTDAQLTPSGRWYSNLLAEFDAGAHPRDIAARILIDSPMIIPIVTNYISWEIARHAFEENYPAAKRLSELWLLLADPNFARRAGDLTTSTAPSP